MATAPMKYDVPFNGLEWLEWYDAHNVYHPGWDLNKGSSNQDKGLPVVAWLDGEIEYIAPEGKSNGGFGNFMIIYHPAYGFWTRYAHLDRIDVRQGEKVEEGQQVGTCGNTGTTYAHLHWEVFNQALYNIQKTYWKGPFRYYPSGKSKQWIQQHYIDGLKTIDELNKAHWSDDAMDWMVDSGLLKKRRNWTDQINFGEFVVILERLYNLSKK